MQRTLDAYAAETAAAMRDAGLRASESADADWAERAYRWIEQ
jgi:hypothetical protein